MIFKRINCVGGAVLGAPNKRLIKYRKEKIRYQIAEILKERKKSFLKIEINLKIILLGILFFVLQQLDLYVIFIIFIVLHEMAHLVVGMIIRA